MSLPTVSEVSANRNLMRKSIKLEIGDLVNYSAKVFYGKGIKEKGQGSE